MRLIASLILLCASVCSCSKPEPGPTEETLPDTPPLQLPDAAVIERLLAERRQPPPPLADVPFNPGGMRGDDSAWRSAQSFRFEVRTKGDLRERTVWVDDTGHVHFRGSAGAPHPGSYELQMPPEQARQLQTAVLDSGFLWMHERYAQLSDGCQLLGADYGHAYLTLTSDALVKRVEYYFGCFADLPELDTLEALIAHVHMTLPIAGLLESPERSACTGTPMPYEPSYVLQDERGRPAGVLKLEPFVSPTQRPRPRWRVEDCTGTPVVDGALEWAGSCNSPLITDADSTFAWPGIDHPISAVLLSQAPDRGITLRLLEADSESTRVGRAGDSCN